MPAEHRWELVENPSKFNDYHVWSDDLPARKFYLFVAEIGRRLRHFMTDSRPLEVLDFCEQCAEGRITEDEFGRLAAARQTVSSHHEPFASAVANELFFWSPDRYKVLNESVAPAAEVFAVVAAAEAGLISPRMNFAEIQSLPEHLVYATVLERTELEWGALVRDIYGPNPFRPVTFSPAWRTPTVVGLARQVYESRDFSGLPILADALQDVGCEDADALAHCRGRGPHVRGCWVVDACLGKAQL